MKKLILSIFGLVFLAGCATDGYVGVNTTITPWPPVYIDPYPVYHYSPYYYHGWYHDYRGHYNGHYRRHR